jgi:hypothetical protein
MIFSSKDCIQRSSAVVGKKFSCNEDKSSNFWIPSFMVVSVGRLDTDSLLISSGVAVL